MNTGRHWRHWNRDVGAIHDGRGVGNRNRSGIDGTHVSPEISGFGGRRALAETEQRDQLLQNLCLDEPFLPIAPMGRFGRGFEASILKPKIMLLEIDNFEMMFFLCEHLSKGWVMP